mgnify:CR=1 FL=1
MEALHGDRLADVSLGDDQRVDVEIMIVLGVRDRAFQGFLHRLGDPLAREGQVRESAVDLLVADQLRDEVEFLRADAKRTGYRPGLVVLQRALGLGLAHGYFLFAFLSAPCP